MSLYQLEFRSNSLSGPLEMRNNMTYPDLGNHSLGVVEVEEMLNRNLCVDRRIISKSKTNTGSELCREYVEGKYK